MSLVENVKIEDFTQTDSVSLTKEAAQAVKDLLEKKNLENYGLRVFIRGGGCSGFQYGMALDNQIRDNDKTFSHHGVELIIDDGSFSYLVGATIDYVEDLMGAGFKVENPNAASSCGCGSSFNTKEGGSEAPPSGSSCNSCH